MIEEKVPLISIVVPTYNGEKYIVATVKSVLQQSFNDWELIIIDDASSDMTLKLIRQFDDSRIKIYDGLGNVGAQANWSRAQKYVRGKYFKLLPQDDLLAADCLQKQVDVLERDPQEEIALVFASRQVIGPNGDLRMIRGYKGTHKSTRITGREVINRCTRSGANIIGEPGSGLIRSDLMRKIGAYTVDHPYVIDLDYWFRALQHGDAYYIAEPLTSFRISLGAWSVRLGKKQIADYISLVRKIYADPQYELSYFSMRLGILNAHINSRLRFIYYKFFV